METFKFLLASMGGGVIYLLFTRVVLPLWEKYLEKGLEGTHEI